MTTNTDVVNRALQSIGTRTTVTDGELAANSSNEAIQANLILTKYRDQLLRMAPWDCGLKVGNLIWLTSLPGTPENTSPATFNWQPGQPPPPWAYEYFYPDDCLRACWIVPNQQIGFAQGVPITTAITGGAPATWLGQPIKFEVRNDQFRSASGLAITAAGSGYQVNDTVVLGTDTLNNLFNANAVPAGIIKIKVDTVDGSGGITGASLVAFDGTQVAQNGFLYGVPTYTLAAVQTSGLGTGAQATISGVSQTRFDARVIVTDQEYAALAYVKQVTDPNVMDDMFVEAWAYVLGAGICMALTGDKGLANESIAKANDRILQARKVDGNEGLTVNDVTPDWIRIRGIAWTEYYSGPYSTFDWGALWPVY